MKKKIAAILISALIAITAASCTCRYNEDYYAVGQVSAEGNTNAFMRFHEFRGRRVLDLRNSNDDYDTVYYTASLESGSISVYIDYNGTKRELFYIESGEEIDASLEGLDLEKVYIIVEADGNCYEGDLDFNIGR